MPQSCAVLKKLFGFGPWQAGEACLAEGTPEVSWNQGSELSDATLFLQGDVVVDMTHSDDKLILTPGNAVLVLCCPENYPMTQLGGCFCIARAQHAHSDQW
jgi:hypothetical protein